MSKHFVFDVDGTLTPHHERIPEKVLKSLEGAADKGVRVSFVTGRTLPRTLPLFRTCRFPFTLCVQNGARGAAFPGGKEVLSSLLTQEYVDKAVAIAQELSLGIFLYADDSQRDLCYYCPELFWGDQLEYALERGRCFSEEWQETSHLLAPCPALKVLGKKEPLLLFQERVAPFLETQVISDPFSPGVFVAQATKKGVHKGSALAALKRSGEQLVVFGDDWNDKPMWDRADLKVVMATAPKELLAEADIVAPPASEEGVCQVIEEIL